VETLAFVTTTNVGRGFRFELEICADQPDTIDRRIRCRCSFDGMIDSLEKKASSADDRVAFDSISVEISDFEDKEAGSIGAVKATL